jgi:hypothetical protein
MLAPNIVPVVTLSPQFQVQYSPQGFLVSPPQNIYNNPNNNL